MSDDHGLDLPLLYSGKVRRMYALPADDGAERLLMVATDNISAYDQVLSTPIPDKGAVLTQLSLWWFDKLADVVDNHVVSTEVPDAVRGRAIVAEKLDMIPVECVARGYLTGSGWAEYAATGTVAGVELPAGLTDGARLPEPLFTPAVKAPLGEHDENVTFDHIIETHGMDTAIELRDRTLDLYTRAERIALERGIVLADTKFEFGRRADGTLVLADEVLTPDSSRFWDAAGWRPADAASGTPASLPSFDKQYVRDWLTRDSGWDRASDAPAPPLPDHVIAATRARYIEAYERLTGLPFVAASPAHEAKPSPDPWADLPTTITPTVPPANLLVGGAHAADEVGGVHVSDAAPVGHATDEVGGRTASESTGESDSIPSMATDRVSTPAHTRVIVDVMPKPEILDPQGKAVTGALKRLGYDGLTVRQGKRFEIEVDGEITEERLAQVRDAAEKLLANTVIEAFDVRVDQ